MNEMIVQGAPAEMAQVLNDLRENLVQMAMVLRQTNDRMKALEDEVHRLTKVTASQASGLNRAIRDRAAALAQQHRADGCEAEIASAIRKAVKLTVGVTAMRDVPRGDYEVAMRAIGMWDDYRMILNIRRKRGAK